MTTPERDRIRLRFWQDGTTLSAIASVMDEWWDTIRDYLDYLTSSIDPETAPVELVDLMAWQRDIDRMDDEPEELYRKRVKYAYANARDAGSRAGFQRIWDRLGLGDLTQSERLTPETWDVIRLRIDERIFAQYNGLFDTLISQYGRTCRRYVWDSVQSTASGIPAIPVGCETEHVGGVGTALVFDAWGHAAGDEDYGTEESPVKRETLPDGSEYIMYTGGYGAVYRKTSETLSDGSVMRASEIAFGSWDQRAELSYAPCNQAITF